MDHYPLLLGLHLIGASIWTGGHLVLAIGILPSALARRDVTAITPFEAVFERLGLPALAVQIVTGVLLALQVSPNAADWFTWKTPIDSAVGAKLILLATTALLAVHARLFIIPKLTAERLAWLAVHIVTVTILSVAFVLTGVAFRFGGIGA